MYQQQKKVTASGSMGSKSKLNLMKSYKNIKKEAGLIPITIGKQKKENALDIISKSLQKNRYANYLNGSGSILINS